MLQISESDLVRKAVVTAPVSRPVVPSYVAGDSVQWLDHASIGHHLGQPMRAIGHRTARQIAAQRAVQLGRRDAGQVAAKFGDNLVHGRQQQFGHGGCSVSGHQFSKGGLGQG